MIRYLELYDAPRALRALQELSLKEKRSCVESAQRVGEITFAEVGEAAVDLGLPVCSNGFYVATLEKATFSAAQASTSAVAERVAEVCGGAAGPARRADC